MNALAALRSTLTMKSSEVASLSGVRHDDVKRQLQTLIEAGVMTGTFNAGPDYEMNRLDTLMLLAALSPKFMRAVIERWDELENKLLDTLAAHQEPYFSYADWKMATKFTDKITYKDECNMRVFPYKLQRMGGNRDWVKMVGCMLYMNDPATLILTAILAPKSVSGLYVSGPDEHLGECMALASTQNNTRLLS